MFTGEDKMLAKKKDKTLSEFYAKHPERFVNGKPTSPRLPTEVSINSLSSEDNASENGLVNFPTLTYVKRKNELQKIIL